MALIIVFTGIPEKETEPESGVFLMPGDEITPGGQRVPVMEKGDTLSCIIIRQETDTGQKRGSP
jgi:hypothetical protein